MSPSSDFFFLDSFFTVNRPSRLPGLVYTFPLIPCKGTWLPASYWTGFARHSRLVPVLSTSFQYRIHWPLRRRSTHLDWLDTLKPQCGWFGHGPSVGAPEIVSKFGIQNRFSCKARRQSDSGWRRCSRRCPAIWLNESPSSIFWQATLHSSRGPETGLQSSSRCSY